MRRWTASSAATPAETRIAATTRESPPEQPAKEHHTIRDEPRQRDGFLATAGDRQPDDQPGVDHKRHPHPVSRPIVSRQIRSTRIAVHAMSAGANQCAWWNWGTAAWPLPRASSHRLTGKAIAPAITR